MYNWDYQLEKNWQPKTDEEWQWYLSRLINYGLGGVKLNQNIVKKYLPDIQINIEKRRFLEFILNINEDNTK